MFYIYEWYNKDTDEVFYVGKGSKKRYLVRKHNKFFNYYINTYNCESRIIKYFNNEEDAFKAEFDRIKELKEIGQCICNIMNGGAGGTVESWTPEKRERYSKYNVMKSEKQRERMSKNNPMKIKKYAMKNGLKHRKPFYIGENEYQTLNEAAEKYNVTIQCIYRWLKNKHNSKNEKCFYKIDNQQPSTNLKG